MADFSIRALETNSKQYAWDYDWIVKALRFIKARNMNALVLHRNDFIDEVVYPGYYFGAKREKYNSIYERYQDIFRMLYKYTPTRRSSPVQRRSYLRRVIEMAKRDNIDIFIENKELYFPDILLEFHPELVQNGKVCASHPFWWEFTKVKLEEFFEEFPEIAGIITAPATGESRVSISSNRCTCERCRNTSRQEWFERLVMAMYEPIKAAGKKLIVRDFVFDREAHNDIVGVMEQLPGDIDFALKNTPHDFYPTFPDNLRIGHIGEHQQWIEFDAMGQYYGWGIGPSIMIDDYRRRMKLAKELGATAVIVRTDWEALDGHSAFHTLNFINLYAFSALSEHLEADSTVIYQDWMEDHQLLDASLTESQKRDTAAWLEGILSRTWDIIRRTVYVNDCVFSDSSQLPLSLEHALWLAEEKNSLKEWLPEKTTALSTDEDNIRFILAEKDEALELVRNLVPLVQTGHPGITEEGHRYLTNCFDIFEKYVRAFRIAAQAIMLKKYKLDHTSDNSAFAAEAEQMLKEKLADLIEMAEEFKAFFAGTDFGHRVYTLLDADRLLALHGDLSRK